jgi:hypothetical protein
MDLSKFRTKNALRAYVIGGALVLLITSGNLLAFIAGALFWLTVISALGWLFGVRDDWADSMFGWAVDPYKANRRTVERLFWGFWTIVLGGLWAILKYGFDAY